MKQANKKYKLKSIIKVISYREGEITSKTHNEKLMTYLRYWQAEGESLKTSMRVTDAGEQNVRAGKWRGGCPPYGYHSVSRGTLNYKGKPIFDVEIDPETSEVVRRFLGFTARNTMAAKA